MATTPSWVKIPEVVAEVTAAFARYEAALVGNDVDALNAAQAYLRHIRPDDRIVGAAEEGLRHH